MHSCCTQKDTIKVDVVHNDEVIYNDVVTLSQWCG